MVCLVCLNLPANGLETVIVLTTSDTVVLVRAILFAFHLVPRGAAKDSFEKPSTIDRRHFLPLASFCYADEMFMIGAVGAFRAFAAYTRKARIFAAAKYGRERVRFRETWYALLVLIFL